MNKPELTPEIQQTLSTPVQHTEYRKHVEIPGHWEHLVRLSGKNQNAAIKEFLYWFNKYHNVCILNKWTTNRDTNTPYMFVEILGVFTDLNLLARRIKNELYDEKYREQAKVTQPSFDFFQDTLHISLISEENYQVELQVEYNSLNETEKIYHEGWKFNI